MKREGFTPVEKLVDLVALGQIDHPELSCGFYILQRKRTYRCIFGFKTPGIHAHQSPQGFAQAWEGLATLGRELPAGGRLQIRLSSFREDHSRLAALQALRTHTISQPLDWLMAGEQERVAELAADGRRRQIGIYLFASWSEWSAQTEARDWIDRAALKAHDWWLSYLGEVEADQKAQIQRLTQQAFVHCRQWLNILNVGARLDVQPMHSEELMAWTWKQFNDTPAPPIPKQYRWQGDGLQVECQGELAFGSVLFETPLQLSAEQVSLRLADGTVRHGAVMVWDEKPAGFIDAAQQLRYLWQLIARPEVQDTEIVVELSTLNEQMSRDNAMRLQRQATSGLKLSQNQGKLIDVAQQMKLEEAAELEKAFIQGARPLYIAVAVLVWRTQSQALPDSCRFISSFFHRPARLVREVSYAWKIYLQSLPFTWDALLVSPFDRRMELLDEEAPGFLPLVCVHGSDRQGIEMISEEGFNPIWLDLYQRHRNLALFGTTRSGKSVILEVLIRHALAQGIPVVAMDFPKPDGSSTFSDYTAFLGGAYFDVGRHCLNLFELPDLRTLKADLRKERLEEFQEFLVSALMVMVLGRTLSDPLLSQTVRSVLQLAVNAFFAERSIRERYDLAIRGGVGSEAWKTYPSLPDLMPFIDPERLGLDSIHLGAAFEQVRLRLNYWLGSRVGQKLSQPSTICADSPLLVFALRNVSNEEDMAVLALANYAAALRRALATPVSLFILDEAPILFECAEIANLVARLCANGAKAGVRVILSAQDPDTIEKAPNSSKIFQNLGTRLIGRIEANAIPSFARIFGYTEASLARNASAQFFPNRREIFSRWLIDDGGTLIPARYYPCYRALAVVANNPDEQKSRSAFLAAVGTRYPDTLAALADFSRHYVQMLRSKGL